MWILNVLPVKSLSIENFNLCMQAISFQSFLVGHIFQLRLSWEKLFSILIVISARFAHLITTWIVFHWTHKVAISKPIFGLNLLPSAFNLFFNVLFIASNISLTFSHFFQKQQSSGIFYRYSVQHDNMLSLAGNSALFLPTISFNVCSSRYLLFV